MELTTLIGILDIGSNSVMLTVAKADLCKPEILFELCRVTSLGENSATTGELQELPMKRTEEAIVEFTQKARSIGVKDFAGTATSAVRDAKNGQEFIQRISQKIGYTPEILSGGVEAELVFLGSTYDLEKGQKIITCDPGGGSTEINIGTVGEKPSWSHSFNVGCVRQGNKFNLCDDEISAENMITARTEIAAEMNSAFTAVDNLGDYELYISAGTATTFAAMNMNLQKYDRETIHHHQAKLADLESWIDHITQLSLAERHKNPTIGNRAATIPTGLLIMSEAVKGFNKNKFTVTTTALRYGMVLQFSEKILTKKV